MKPIKHYSYRSAMAKGRCVVLPREMFYQIVNAWHKQLGTYATNHETFEFLDQDCQTRYITLTDSAAIIGTEISTESW